MSLQAYSVVWSDGLIGRVEAHLRDLHSAIHQYYEAEGYATSVADKSNPGGNANADDDDAGAVLDVVSPAGSFLHRTCVHAVPFANLHAERGVGADLVITMPVEKCSQADVQDGRYLESRHQFLGEIEACLKRLIEAAARKVAAANNKDEAAARKKRARDDGDDAAEKEKEEDDDEEAEARTAANMAAAERLARMTVHRMPIHGCYANGAKEILRVRFVRRRSASADTAGAHQHNRHEVFYVDLHFRPAQHSGRVMSAAAARKHPYYSYLVLEDFMMPTYLKKIHRMCVQADGLRRALVILKCWAHHVGLMSAASGHQEGLNGFLLGCMLLKLHEDGIIANNTSEENAARAVWIRLSHGYFLAAGANTAAAAGPASAGTIIPAAEERGEVAVLRLSGDVMNVLFRCTTGFFKNVVQRAAEEAFAHPIASAVFKHTPFQQLHLRYDVALTLRNTNSSAHGEREADDDEAAAAYHRLASARAAASVKKSTVLLSPIAQQVRDTCARTLDTALTNRASFLSAWPTGPHTVHVIVQLTSEPDGRNHITRGPAIEDTDAVAAFNAFWGMERTSTRQFPDGAIYRCVLWSFPEVVGTRATAALSASTVIRAVAEYALRRHVSPAVTASVFLGGLEGFLAERVGAEWRDGAQLMQRSLREASLAVQKMMADLPRAVLPCQITEFAVIAASERGTEVFPVRPHFALTTTTDALDAESFVGLSTAPTIEPIHCVMAIDDKGKIPDNLEAIRLMKGAICAQLAKHVQQHYQPKPGMKKKDDPKAGATTADTAPRIHAMASSQAVDLICQGYLFRVYVAHYREVSLLRALQREPEADLLEQKLFWTTQHAKLTSSIVYGHHSYANAVRLAKRWVSAMMLYEFISPEAVELLVANAYLSETGTSTSTSTTGTTSTVSGAPRTAVGGFLRFIQLLASHDWTHALVLPFTDDEKDPATAARKLVRKPAEHQAMYVASPYAPTESPFTTHTPRPMILHRLVQLAKGVLSLLMGHIAVGTHSHDGDEAAVERAMFTSSPAAFDFAMAFHPQLILQPDRCITVQGGGGSAPLSLAAGGSDHGVDGSAAVASASAGGGAAPVAPSAGAGDAAVAAAASRTIVRLRQLDELEREQSREYVAALVEREPAAHAVRIVRAELRDQGMVFYDALAPSTLHVVGVSALPVPRKSLAMHDTVLRVTRGAVLAAPQSAFARGAAAAAPAPAARTGRSAASNKAANGKGGAAAAVVDAKDPQSLMSAKAAQMSGARRSGKAPNHNRSQSQQGKGGEGMPTAKPKQCARNSVEKAPATKRDGDEVDKKKPRGEAAKPLTKKTKKVK